MPVTMIATFPGNAMMLEDLVNADDGSIITDAKARGLISHRFVGGTGEFLVIDEWASESAFNGFFEANEEKIRTMMGPALSGEPTIRLYRNLDTKDRV